MSEEIQKKANAAGCPAKLFGTACLVCVCATICFIAWVYAPRPEPPRRSWLPVMIETNGDEMVMKETRRLEFWTPSVETKNYLYKEGGQVIPTDKWEDISSDDTVMQFGTMLHSNKNVLGYRRVEVWGQGSTHFKPGWWWTVNVYTDYTVVDFAKFYDAYWKLSRPVFIEVIDNRGGK